MLGYKTLSCDNPEYYKKLGVADYNKKDLNKYKSRNDFLYLFLDPQFNPRLYYKTFTYAIATIKVKENMKNEETFNVYVDITDSGNESILYFSNFTDDSDIIINDYCARINVYEYDNIRNIHIDTINGHNKCGSRIEKVFFNIFYVSSIFNINHLFLMDASNFEYKNINIDDSFKINTKFIRYFIGKTKNDISIYNKFGFKYKEGILNKINIPFPNEITIKEIYYGFKELIDNFNEIKILNPFLSEVSLDVRNTIYNDINELCIYLEKNLNITFEKFIKDEPKIFYNMYKKITYVNILYKNGAELPNVIQKLIYIFNQLLILSDVLYLELSNNWFESISTTYIDGGSKFSILNIFYIIIIVLIILLLYLIYNYGRGIDRGIDCG